MFRRSATAIGITLAGAALALGVSSTTATAAPAEATTTASVRTPFYPVAWYGTELECKNAGKAGEWRWGIIWWCEQRGVAWALIAR
ncbi:hypothetical protein ABT354_19020 [Streptomyces sp. NPDC000594]|uniref:hypothetical protein n=1 Tax=Streptomyces sp. NPDC000594 TaxID=3154261 RepID=UPI0033304602